MTKLSVWRFRSLLVVLALVGAFALTACGTNGVDTDCGLDQCTVTFDRGAEAKTSILGVEAEIVKVQGDQVTVKVAGEEIGLTVGQGKKQVGGFDVEVVEVTPEKVVIRISRGSN